MWSVVDRMRATAPGLAAVYKPVQAVIRFGPTSLRPPRRAVKRYLVSTIYATVTEPGGC